MRHLIKFTKYGTVALGSAATDWIIFTSLVLPNLANPLVAQMVSRIGGGIFSITANKYWSFKSQEGKHLLREGRRFLLLYAFSYCLSVSLFYVFSEIADISAYLAKLLTDSTIFVVNFIVMNTYVFHGRAGIGHLIAKRLRRSTP